MSTGTFENWAGEIAEIGVIYPFEGAEWLFVIAGLAFWIIWHIRMFRNELDDLKKQTGELTKEKLQKILSAENAGNE